MAAPSLADVVDNLTPTDTVVDLSKLGVVQAGNRSATLRYPNVTFMSSTPDRLPLAGFVTVHVADHGSSPTFENLVLDGAGCSAPIEKELDGRPEATWFRGGGLLQFAGVKGAVVRNVGFCHSRVYGQLAFSGSTPPPLYQNVDSTNCLVDDCDFEWNGALDSNGHPLPAPADGVFVAQDHTADQEHQTYDSGHGDMGLVFQNCRFHDNPCGAVIKLAASDPGSGAARKIDMTDIAISGVIQLEFVLGGHTGTLTRVVSTAAWDGVRGSVKASGVVTLDKGIVGQTTFVDSQLPGGTVRLIAPANSPTRSVIGSLLGTNPMVTGPGVTNSSKGTYVRFQ